MPVSRVFDIAAASAGLIVLAPVILAIGMAVALTDGFPVFFRQVRVGRNGRTFRMIKFRSMRMDQRGTRITAGGDRRVTRTGKLLRKYKLDELPQLWNVLVGEMSLIGPRPEVPAFVDLNAPVWRDVLRARPGITDVASLVYRNEEQMLMGASDPERYYRDVILPDKLALNVRYLENRSFRRDLRVLWMTAASSLFPRRFEHQRVRRLFPETERT